MKIHLLDPEHRFEKALQGLSCALGEVVIDTSSPSAGPTPTQVGADVIVAGGDFSVRSNLTERLLSWRTHPHTCLIPCWITADESDFERRCLWPRLSIDRFDPQLDASAFCEWLNMVAEWQQTRMNLGSDHTLSEHGALEIATALALRKATGRLSLLDEEGEEGSLFFEGGSLTDACIKHLRGSEAFYEFFSWSTGSCRWEPGVASPDRNAPQPLNLLIQDALNLIREANLLHHFLPDLGHHIVRTESESALDDGAVPFYAALKQIYTLVDGSASAAQILQASPLSSPRTMSALAKWFSLGDVTLVAHEEPVAPRRLLIVDDSNLMCRALVTIFSKDPRFQIVGVAHDGVDALKLIEQQNPDVLTLDMQMPRMDGLTTLKHIMIRDPRPVVVLSAFTRETSLLTYESFKYGAVDVLTKPSQTNPQQIDKEAEQLRDRVAHASAVRMEAAQYIRRHHTARRVQEGQGSGVLPVEPQLHGASGLRLVIVGCGAGGFPQLLKLLFSFSGVDGPPLMMVACMAMPLKIMEALLPNLQRDCPMGIEALAPGMQLRPGCCYVTSSEESYRLVGDGVKIRAEKLVAYREGHRAFDQLLTCVSETFGSRVTALFLSGTGSDGIEGMRAVRQRGGTTFVLSPEACLKPDLPRKMIEQGHAREVKTAAELAALLERPPEASRGSDMQ